MHSLTFASPLGPIQLHYTQDGVSRLGFSDEMPGSDDHLHPYACSILAYLSGEATLDYLPIDVQIGTPLQRQVWRALRTISYGKTITYSELAMRIANLRAVRAVASACAKNPIPLIIPCHRVIGKNGSLTGFSLGGIEIKRQLLGLELKHLPQSQAA